MARAARRQLRYEGSMKVASTYWVNGVSLGLLVAGVAVACGSGDGRKHERAAGGAGGDGGAKVVASAGDGVQAVGGGGQPGEMSAGQGGMPPMAMAGEGGAPIVVGMGGMGGVLAGGLGGAGGAAGAGDVPDGLPLVECEPVVFADSRLEDAVRTALDKSGPLTLDDMASLTTLDAHGYGIADLSGIECFTEVTELDLGFGGGASKVTNFAPLRYLKKLNNLNLSSNPVQTLEPLGELPSLQRLRLSNAVDSVSLAPLATAPALVRLDLDSNAVGDLTPLGSIASLEEIWLTSSTLSAPSSLSALTQVQRLYLSGSQLADATPLAALTSLKELELDSNANLANFNSLSTLINLTRLSAGSTGITSISAVASMTKLQTLHLHFNQVADISPIQGLVQLQSLALNGNPVTDIAPLVANSGLAAGDQVILTGTSLDCQTQGANVTALINRQVTVTSPCN